LNIKPEDSVEANLNKEDVVKTEEKE